MLARIWTLKFVVVASVLAGAVFSAVPARAEASGPEVDVPQSGFVELQTASDGSQYWEITVRSDRTWYLGSWDSNGRLYETVEQSAAAYTATQECIRDVARTFYPQFNSLDDALASPDVQKSVLAPGEFYLNTAPARACSDRFGDTSPDAISVDSGTAILRIPYEMLGAGTYSLFIATVESSKDCLELGDVVLKDGESITGYCSPAMQSEPTFFTVTVPNVTASDRVLPGPAVTDDSWFDQTVFSNLRTIDKPEAGSLQASAQDSGDLLGAALVVATVTTVLAILIALPTALIESTIEGNRSRLARFFRGLLPFQPSPLRRKGSTVLASNIPDQANEKTAEDAP